MWAGSEGCRAKGSHLSLLCLQFAAWYRYLRAAGESKAFRLHWCWFIFRSHVSYAKKKRGHSSQALDWPSAQWASQVRVSVAPNDVYDPNHIRGFRWTFSSAHAFRKLAALKPLMRAAVINWLNIQVEGGGGLEIRVLGTTRTGCWETEMTPEERTAQHRCDCKWKPSIAREGSWEEAPPNSDRYWGKCWFNTCSYRGLMRNRGAAALRQSPALDSYLERRELLWI